MIGTVLLFGDVRGAVRIYSDYFEETTGDGREGVTIAAKFGGVYRPVDVFSIEANVGYTYNDSTIDVLDYEEIAATVAASLRFRF